MSLDDWHLVFVSVVFSLVLIASAPVAMTYFPRKIQPFSTIAVLGEEGKIGQYFPEDNPAIEIGDRINWTLYLYNHMGKTQYFVVKIKLLNSTMQAPNSTLRVPSPAPVVFEVHRFLLHDETSLCIFDWSLLNITKIRSSTRVDSMIINDKIIHTNVQAVNGNNFRLVLELWVYDVSTEKVDFGYKSSEESYGSWNQIWFNTTITN
jgi:hypothetical protein